MQSSTAVLGAGSWGTALAILIARNGHPVTLWGHDPEHIARLSADLQNRRYLPDSLFPDSLSLSNDLKGVAASSDTLIVVVPSHAFRSTLSQVSGSMPDGSRIAWATKGLEHTTGKLMHAVVAEVLGEDRPMAVLSGPTFAVEVAKNQPTAITVASTCKDFAGGLVSLLHNSAFRTYTTDDLIGVQLGGATKNVLAIAAGVADGFGFGANARAALVTRGLAELMRLCMALGGRIETLMGLAGVGDLILTCTDNQSRNRRFGVGLGKCRSRDEVVAEIGQEIEGIATAATVRQLSQALGIDMPISEQVYRILYEGLCPGEAVQNLLLREPKAEKFSSAD